MLRAEGPAGQTQDSPSTADGAIAGEPSEAGLGEFLDRNDLVEQHVAETGSASDPPTCVESLDAWNGSVLESSGAPPA